MTRRETTTIEKVRAVFLAALMVVSVFGGTVAFSGGAVAVGNAPSFAGDVYTGGEDATISITDSSVAGNDDKIEELEVTVMSESGDEEGVTLEETGKDSHTFDGSIEVSVISDADSFEKGNGLIEGTSGDHISIVDYDGAPSDLKGDSAVLDDGEAPSITDADVNGMRDGNTTVRVDFSEPVHDVDASDFEFTGAGSVEWVTPDTSEDGYVELTFDREIQTGNADSELEVTGSYFDSAGNENSDEPLYVDSVELELDEGMNFVSVPFETGGVGFEALEDEGLLDNVDIVWAYDQTSPGDSHWVSYDPGADENKLDYLYGGQGYVFVVDKPTEIDLRSYTRIAADDGTEDVPGSPQVEQIEPGWNLVGHYHEGTQPVKDTDENTGAFGFGYDEDVGVLGQANDGSMQYVDNADLGEAYWVFTRDSYGLYTPKKSDGGQSTNKMSLSVDSVEISGDDEYAENGETVKVTVDASDGDGLYSLWFVGTELGAESNDINEPDDGLHTKSFTVNVEDTEGDVTVPVIAEDVYGEEKMVEATVTLDTVSPDVSNVQISDATDDDGVVANDDSVQITAAVSDGASGVDSVSADASAFGAGSATLTDDGSTGDETADDGTYSATIIVGSSGSVDDGEQSVTVSATDATGNGGSQAVESGTLPVDNVQPGASWSGYSGGETISGEVDLESQTDLTTDSTSTTTYEYSTDDGDNWNEITSTTSWVSSNAGDGDVTLRVTVEDGQGDSASDTVSVTVDNDQPSATKSSSFPSDDVTDTVDVSSWFDVSKDGGSATYEYSTDGGSNWNEFTDETSWDSAGVTDGDVDVRVTVDDGEGNSAEASGTVTVDNNEGSAEVTNAPTNDVTGTVTVSDWFDVSKDGGSATYEYGDAEQDSWSSISDASSWDSTNADDGSVDVRVTVDDGEGNSPTATATVMVDNNQPSASWSGYSGSETISGEVNLESQTDLTTDGGSTTYEYSTDGTNWNVINSPSTWSTSNAGDGDVTLKVTVDDGEGNSASDTVSVTVDNTDPTVKNFAPAGTTLSDWDGTFTFDISDGTSGVDESTLSVTVEDSNDGDGLEVDTTGVGGPVSYDSESGQVTVDLSNKDVADGKVTISANVDDAASNTGTGTAAFTLDTTVEATDLTATNPDSQNVEVVVTANEELTGLTASDGSGNTLSGFSSDGGDFTEAESGDAYTYTATYDASADGDYTVSLDSASDKFANSDNSPGLSDTVSIDTTSPTASSIEVLDDSGDGNIDAANVVFDEPIDTDSVEASDYTIDGSTTFDSVDTTVGNDQEVQLQLSENEVSGTDSKSVSYSGDSSTNTKDIAGNMLADFTEAAGDVIDSAGATISEISLSGVAGNDEKLMIDFSEPVANDGSVDSSAFDIEVDGSAANTDGVTLNEAGNTATVTLDAEGGSSDDTDDVSSGDEVKVTLVGESGIKDESGNPAVSRTLTITT